MRRMLITLMFSVLSRKSRTFFSFPCLAKEQVCRSWEGAQPGSQPKLASGNIPYCRHHAQYTNGGWLGVRNWSMSWTFFMSLTFFVSSATSASSAKSASAAKSETAAQLVVGW